MYKHILHSQECCSADRETCVSLCFLQAILNTVKAERGECSLEHLQQSTDDEIKNELERFKGVGKKTIACVLMFCLNRHEFPVDTHVWRITKSLGWVPAKATRDEAYAHLNARVPDVLKYVSSYGSVQHLNQSGRCLLPSATAWQLPCLDAL